MRPIPPRMRQELESMPRMRRCTLSTVQDLYGACSGRLRNPEWHHVWTYGGPQINELWAILAGCTYHHDEVKKDPAIKDAFESASLMLATEADLAKYPRKNWTQEMKRLGILKLWHDSRK
jgi:hypothetical protein